MLTARGKRGKKVLILQVWDHVCNMEMDKEKRKEESYSENKGVEWDLVAAGFQHLSFLALNLKIAL